MTAISNPEELLSFQKEQFLSMVQRGVPRLHAAIDIGWSRSRLAHLLADREFMDLVTAFEEYTTDEVEMVLLDKARGGNMEAVKMWLTNRRPDRWVDKREVKHTGQVEVAQVIIDGTRDGLRGLIEAGDRESIIATVMPGGSLDNEVVDAELVD